MKEIKQLKDDDLEKVTGGTGLDFEEENKPLEVDLPWWWKQPRQINFQWFVFFFKIKASSTGYLFKIIIFQLFYFFHNSAPFLSMETVDGDGSL